MLEFLRGRLSEDETLARTVKTGKDEGLARLRDRVLADVEAKRRLVDWVLRFEEAREDRSGVFWEDAIMNGLASVRRGFRSPVIHKLVAAYTDHPDFRPEWLPIEDERELDEEYEPGEYESSTRRRGRDA
nr:DUF6221 family protein [Streptomyces sp. NBC_00830]